MRAAAIVAATAGVFLNVTYGPGRFGVPQARADAQALDVPRNNFTGLNYMGVSIAGGEQNVGSSRPYGYDYVYPRPVELDYFAAKGFGLIRMPLNIARVQPKNLTDLDTVQVGYLKAVVDYALQKNLFVVFDAHNYGYVSDSTNGASRLIGADNKGTSIFVDFWTRMAQKFRNYPNVIFGLMNEPNAQTAGQWKAAAVAAHDAIRAAGATRQLILFQGTNWDGAHNWATGDGGNGDAWKNWKGDANVAFEVHQYLDSDYSGTHAACAANTGATTLANVTKWARQNNVKLFLGEFGWSPDQWQGQATGCGPEARNLMGYLKENKDVWGGWSYWNGGSWLYYGQYMFGVQPTGSVGSYKDAPQLSTLVGNLYEQ